MKHVENLHEQLAFFETHYDELIQIWVNSPIVQEVFLRNKISSEFFENNFATGVVNYFLDIITAKGKMGNCPVMSTMLFLFKKKNIPLKDVHFICSELKNAFVHLLIGHQKLSDELFTELALVLDENLAGVIKDYLVLYYNDHEKFNQIQQIKIVGEGKVERRKNIEIPRAHRTISAEEFVQDVDIEPYVFEELDELEDDVESLLYAEDFLTNNALKHAIALLENYSRVLNALVLFNHLSSSLHLLSSMLYNVDIDDYTNDENRMINTYVLSILKDLKQWRNTIFVTQNVDNIHYLDDTLLSSIQQLQMVLEGDDEDDEDENLEFF
jgi:hypothetical protein